MICSSHDLGNSVGLLAAGVWSGASPAHGLPPRYVCTGMYRLMFFLFCKMMRSEVEQRNLDSARVLG